MNKVKTILVGIGVTVLALASCDRRSASASDVQIPSFPYQVYLDSLDAHDDEVFPTIGDGGQGFDAISDNIRYPEMPDTLSLSHFADSLLQYYNIFLLREDIYRLRHIARDIKMRRAPFINYPYDK